MRVNFLEKLKMGCCYSRINQEEMVSRCKSRRKYMKNLVKSRQSFSVAHSLYLRSLKNTGSALLEFAANETTLRRRLPPPPPPLYPSTPPPPPIPMSPLSDSWTTTTTTSSKILPPPPPPPPAVEESTTSWDFWDPFMPGGSRSVTEDEEWEEETRTQTTTMAASHSMTRPSSIVSGFSKEPTYTTATANSSDEMAVVVSTKGKDLVEVIKELDEYFLKAAGAGGQLSLILEVPTCTMADMRSYSYKGKIHGKNLNPLLWNSSPKWSGIGKFCEDPIGNVNHVGNGSSHGSTVERLYAWEKKLYDEVKNAEMLKVDHEKKAEQLRKLEIKRADYLKTEKAKKEVEKLESRLMVATQAIDSISSEIIKLRESELYPQLVDLVNGLMGMWRSMYECHQVQTHIVQQLKYVDTITSNDPTSEIHRQSALQLELEVQQWHLSFCNFIKTQKEYIQSLTGWLRLSLSLFQYGNNKPVSKTELDSAIYAFCEEWQLAVNNAPDKVASEGILSLYNVIHDIVVQQGEEQKQKKKSEAAFKALEKKGLQLRSLESKYGGHYSMAGATRRNGKDPVVEKRSQVAALRAKAEEEKAKYEKAVSVTRSMTLNNLQMGLPHVFQAVTGFANVCTHSFESVYNQAKINGELQGMKRLLLC